MSDMAAVIVPKSDQINADDLIGGDLTIRITAVSVSPGQEQPVSMKFEGSQKVYRPCKSMARVMVAAWGPDSSAYVGRSLQLYRDPSVKWGGMDVGGIRIRKMSHMPEDRPMTMALTATKGSRKPYTVQPLAIETKKPADTGMSAEQALLMANREAEKGTDHFRAWFNSAEGKACRATGALTPEVMLTMKAAAEKADAATSEDPFGLPPVPSDTEIQARLASEHAAFLAEQERQAG